MLSYLIYIYIQVCPVDCVLSSWTYGSCTVSCGGGTQRMTRSIKTTPVGTGRACEALTSSQVCNVVVSIFWFWLISLTDSLRCLSQIYIYIYIYIQVCPVDCVLSAWSSFGACSVTCGSGMGSRTRSITTTPVGTGKACEALASSQVCNFVVSIFRFWLISITDSL